MAPECLDGKAADARADIFALGVVLYEMLCGRRPFEGDSKGRLIAAILEHEPPPVSEFQPLASPALDHLMNRCLAKDPEERWQSARDVATALEWVADAGSEAGLPVPVARRRDRRRRWRTVALGGLLGAVLAALGAWRLLRPSPAPPRPSVRLELALDPPPLFSGYQRTLALSPDGSLLVYVTGSPGGQVLARRELSEIRSAIMAGTEGGGSPFFSPDGRWLAFQADGHLKKVPVAGGAVQTLCAAVGLGGSWGPDDTIAFGGGPGQGLLRVSAHGGAPERLTSLDASQQESEHACSTPC
jgi:serine/threonine-protein kinase